MPGRSFETGVGIGVAPVARVFRRFACLNRELERELDEVDAFATFLVPSARSPPREASWAVRADVELLL
jgi:hypothetical protein